jgi:hypothetical protein
MSTQVLVPSWNPGTQHVRPSPWQIVKDGNPTARAIFGRHYTYNKRRDQIDMWNAARNRNWSLFAGPGQKTVLLADGPALFVWRKFIDDCIPQQDGVNCAVFRREGGERASDLIRAADEIAWQRWPGERLYTYIDRDKTRPKRDPGYCFLAAGWHPCGETKGGLCILENIAGSTSAANSRAPQSEKP